MQCRMRKMQPIGKKKLVKEAVDTSPRGIALSSSGQYTSILAKYMLYTQCTVHSGTANYS